CIPLRIILVSPTHIAVLVYKVTIQRHLIENDEFPHGSSPLIPVTSGSQIRALGGSRRRDVIADIIGQQRAVPEWAHLDDRMYCIRCLLRESWAGSVLRHYNNDDQALAISTTGQRDDYTRALMVPSTQNFAAFRSIAAKLRSTSSSVVAHDETLIRIAACPC